MTKQKLTWQNAPEQLKTSQAATLANVHLNSIQTWVKAGRLPAKKIGAHWRITKADLAAMVGVTLAANGRAIPTPNVLGNYADRLDAALELPAGQMLGSIQRIISDMRSEAGNE